MLHNAHIVLREIDLIYDVTVCHFQNFDNSKSTQWYIAGDMQIWSKNMHTFTRTTNVSVSGMKVRQ